MMNVCWSKPLSLSSFVRWSQKPRPGVLKHQVKELIFFLSASEVGEYPGLFAALFLPCSKERDSVLGNNPGDW